MLPGTGREGRGSSAECFAQARDLGMPPSQRRALGCSTPATRARGSRLATLCLLSGVACGPSVAHSDGSGDAGDESGSSGSDGSVACEASVTPLPWCYREYQLPGITDTRAAIAVDLGGGLHGIAVMYSTEYVDNVGDLRNTALVTLDEEGEPHVATGEPVRLHSSPRRAEIRSVRMSDGHGDDILAIGVAEEPHHYAASLLVHRSDTWIVDWSENIAEDDEDRGRPVVAIVRTSNDQVVLVGHQTDGGGNDGPRDLVVRRWHRSAGAWEPDAEGLALPEFRSEGAYQVGDFDRDGDEDVLGVFVLADDSTHAILLLRSDGSEPMELVPERGPDVGPDLLHPTQLDDFDILDADGDGTPDVVAWTASSGHSDVQVFRGRGDGTFEAPVEHRGVAGWISQTAHPRIDDTGDKLLTLSAEAPATTSVLEALTPDSEQRVFYVSPLIGAKSGLDPVQATDANADGLDDVILSRRYPDYQDRILISSRL